MREKTIQIMIKDKKLHRVFIAVDFTADVVKEVARVQKVLGGRRFTGKITELENLHLTLKFLGEISSEMLENVKEKLGEIKIKEFEAKLEGIGSFSFRGRPRIVWIKIGGKGIFSLQKKVDEKLEEIGFKREERFMSHMTIARIKYVKDKKGFVEYVNGIGLKDIRFQINEFKLKESELRSLGPVYRDLEVYFSL